MKILEGIRVLDLSRVVSGPYCTMLLGDMGAEVIKIEHPVNYDETRTWGPPFFSNGNSAYYIAVNRNKKAITLDIKKEKGKKILEQLIEQSDVLVENFRLGVMDKLGFSYEKVAEINPQIIYCSINGFGSNGPYSNLGAYDVLIQAIGGLISITGFDEPTKVGVPIVDIITALFSSQSIIGALFYRARTGKGQKVECSLFESQIAMLLNVASNYLISGQEAIRYGNEHPNIVPYQVYEASNGKFILTVTNEKLWNKFCQLLNIEELNNEKFKTNSDRVKNRKELNSILSKIFKKNTKEYWIDLFNNNDIPAGKINSISEVFNDKHFKHLNIVKNIEIDGKTLKILSPVFNFSEYESKVYLPPPLLGQHNKEIYIDLLKYSEEELEKLKEKGVI
jgi:crotonobetainyl-CoA:carnitine CoA-transferase CaiB-like acyl-CoA transferase